MFSVTVSAVNQTGPSTILFCFFPHIFCLLIYQTLAAARMLTPSGPVGQTHWRDSAANNPPATTNSADAQLKVLWDHIQFLISKCVVQVVHLLIIPIHA